MSALPLQDSGGQIGRKLLRSTRGNKTQLSPKMKACQTLIVELKKRKHAQYTYLFYRPVDVEELPDYQDVIKEPMDLQTAQEKLESGDYNTVKHFKQDILRMISNAKTYNEENVEILNVVLKFEVVVLDRMKIIESRFPEEPDVENVSTQGSGQKPHEENGDETLNSTKFDQPQSHSSTLSTKDPAQEHPQDKIASKASNKNADEKAVKKASQKNTVEEQAAEEQKAAEEKAEEQAAQQNAVEAKAAQQKVAEKKAEEEQAAHQKAAEKKVEEEQAAQQKAAEKKVEEEQAAQQKAAEQKKVEEQAAEEQAAQQKAAEKAEEEQAAQQKAEEEQAAQKAKDKAAKKAAKAAKKEAKAAKKASQAAEQNAAVQKAAEQNADEQKAAEQKTEEEKAEEEQAAEKAKEKAAKKAEKAAKKAEKAAKKASQKKAAQEQADQKAQEEKAAKKAAKKEEKAAKKASQKKAAQLQEDAEKTQLERDKSSPSTRDEMDDVAHNKPTTRAPPTPQTGATYGVSDAELALITWQGFQSDDDEQNDYEDLKIDIKQLYDVELLKDMISDAEESGSIEETVMEVCIGMKPRIEELCSGKLLDWLIWLYGATGVDELMNLSHIIGATGLFMNGSVVVIHKGNGHESPVNIWNYVVAVKGSKKSASLTRILKGVKEVEKDLRAAEELDDSSLLTPIKSVSVNSNSSAASPKKIKPNTRLLQGGTVEGLISTMHKSDKPQVLMAFDELSNLFDRTLNKEGKLTQLGVNLLSMFGSIDTRDVTSGKGIRVIESPFVSIIGGLQPKVLLNTIVKDPDDPASFIDRATIIATETPSLSLRKQSKFMKENREVPFPLKDLFSSTNELHSEESPRWEFDKGAKELIYQIDEVMVEFEEAHKYNGEIRGRQAKGRDQMYRLSAVFAMLRKFGNSIGPDGTSDIQDTRKIILISDVEKAVKLVWYAVFCHLQFKAGARQLACGSKPDKIQKTIPETKKLMVNSLLSDVMDWKKPMDDYIKQSAGKIKELYNLPSSDEDKWVSVLEIFKKKSLYPRNCDRWSNKCCCLFFVRFLNHNGIGEIDGTTEDETVLDPTDKFLKKMRFRLFRESANVPDQSKQLFEALIKEMDYNPFEEEQGEKKGKKKKKKNKRKREENPVEEEKSKEKKPKREETPVEGKSQEKKKKRKGEEVPVEEEKIEKKKSKKNKKNKRETED